MSRGTLSTLLRACLLFFGGRQGSNFADATQRTGISQVLYVRVIGTGSEDAPTRTYDQIFHGVFNESNPISVASSYRAISYDALSFTPMQNTSANIIDGMTDVFLDITTAGTNEAIVVKAAIAALSRVLGQNIGGKTPAGNDLIIFCCPKNTADFGGRAGYASVNGWKSVYRNSYCLSHQTLMHEIGHNLGFGHGGQPDGFMGGICKAKFRTFNAPNSFLSTWYEDRQEVFFPLDELYWEGDIIGLDDYQRNVIGPSVIIQIQGNATNDWYVSFNRVKGINSDNCMDDGIVKIHYKGHPIEKYNPTDGRDMSLNAAGETRVDATWNARPLNIVVNSINTITEPWSANVKIFATCFSDDDCSNGEPCDGEETCGADGACQEGTAIFCAAPSAAPTQFCLDSPTLELENSAEASGGTFGKQLPGSSILFDVGADFDVFIDVTYLKLKNNVDHLVTIYTKEGSYEGFDDSESGWTKLADAVTMQKGEIEFSEPVFVPGGATQAFFVFVEGETENGYISQLKHADANLGDVILSDDYIHISGGIRKSGSFGSKTKGGVYSMSGSLYYHVCKETSSMAPSLSMMPSKSHAPSTAPSRTFSSGPTAVMTETSSTPSRTFSSAPTGTLSVVPSASPSLPGSCKTKADCTEGDACTKTICLRKTGTCSYIPKRKCCITADDCPGNKKCKINICTKRNQCKLKVKKGCCTSSRQCDDKKPCTINKCVKEVCVSKKKKGCCENPRQCDDKKSCTTNKCVDTVCVYTSKCNDRDDCTKDICAKTGCLFKKIKSKKCNKLL